MMLRKVILGVHSNIIRDLAIEVTLDLISVHFLSQLPQIFFSARVVHRGVIGVMRIGSAKRAIKNTTAARRRGGDNNNTGRRARIKTRLVVVRVRRARALRSVRRRSRVLRGVRFNRYLTLRAALAERVKR